MLLRPMPTISEAQRILEKYKVNVVGSVVSLEQALAMKRPIVLKADSAEHKTDKGLVFVGLDTDEAIRDAFAKISKSAGVFAQPVVKGEEVIVGVVEDPTFGRVIMFGAGGIFTEVYKDTAFRVPPLSTKEAEAMIADTRIGRLFEGFRGKEMNKKALVALLVAVSKFAGDGSESFRELDLNPVIVNRRGAFVVDVRMLI